MRRHDLPGTQRALVNGRRIRQTFVHVVAAAERSPSVANRTIVKRPAESTAIAPTATERVAGGERQLRPSHLANARVFSPQSCSCVRSPRAIAHWMLTHSEPAAEPTGLALDREEATLWSSTLTGRVKIEHTNVDGMCVLRLGFTDGRRLTIAMDELRVAATASA